MKDWINRNIDGAGIISVMLILIVVYGLGSLFSHSMAMEKYYVENNMIKVSGYVHRNDLLYHKLKEQN